MSRHIKDANQIMEKIGDFGMMSDAGNKKIARAVSQAKNEKDLKSKLEKISTMDPINIQINLKKMKFTKEPLMQCKNKAKGYKTDQTLMFLFS